MWLILYLVARSWGGILILAVIVRHEGDVSHRSAYCNLGMRLLTSRELLFLTTTQHVQVGGRTNAPCFYLWEFWAERSSQIARVSQVWWLISVAAQTGFHPLGYHRKMLKVHPGSDALLLCETSSFPHSKLADGLFWSCPLPAFLQSITSFLPSECT